MQVCRACSLLVGLVPASQPGTEASTDQRLVSIFRIAEAARCPLTLERRCLEANWQSCNFQSATRFSLEVRASARRLSAKAFSREDSHESAILKV
jgi:hypothetical protein